MMSWSTERVFCVTSDVDWASESVVESAQAILEQFALPVTYFVTHESPLISKLAAADAVQLGIHPNFLPDSSHGGTFRDVLDTCLRLAPGARCWRAHRYFEVDDTVDLLMQSGLRYDSNLCTLLEQDLRPFRHRSGSVRFPIFLEDGAYLRHQLDLYARPEAVFRSATGLFILNVHPIHLALNSPTSAFARKVKDGCSREQYANLDHSDLRRLRHAGRGIADFVQDMLKHVAVTAATVCTLEGLYEEYVGV